MKKYYSMETSGRTADVYIFGDIVDAASTGVDAALGFDFGDVSGLSIVNEIKNLDVDTINVHINSMGGYTNEGIAIFNTLKNSKAKVNTIVDGFACSAASIIFMAGGNRIMNSASILMIHNAWSITEGNAAQMRQQADVLEKISQAAGNAYAEKVTISREELDTMLDGENHEGTWILPEDALKMGFATEISSATESSAASQSAMRMMFQKFTAKPKVATQSPIDVEKLASSVVEKLMEKIPEPPKENNPMKFLSALTGGKD
ncbi:head maturation protease, ClpP-related [Caproiciproducens sp. CPB-2]|uniref:head maturation protease, ClpP-related n=1 Tax=Caproiciproducens sp. CPB-2 TaxID=3030017 RepID=UPI0023DC6933|nr:head maturation protease, ClpP-related [Caproiciproducens sp. CPB-2]MDF1495220.1 Clp protease ClpP [Caproiciproducens sp. CPB-2]